ncbi:membrane protein [Bacteroidia bacterium]|nr:membrane protein [Bacteroidia bacterium]
MNIIERVKNILTTPKAEWQTIEAENAPYAKVCTSYVALLALIPAIASLIGYGLTGFHGFHHSFGLGIGQAFVQYIVMVAGAYISAVIIDALAPSFGATKNLDKAYSLVAYAYTPMFVAGIFYLIPALSWIILLAGLYSLYLLYLGLQPMMKQSDDKTIGYFIVSLIVVGAVTFVLAGVLGAIVTGIFMGGMMMAR